jgi:hypothetical protein
VLAQPANAWREEPTYTAIATEIAKRPVLVYCAEGDDWAPYGATYGLTEIGTGPAWLSPETCAALRTDAGATRIFCGSGHLRFCPAFTAWANSVRVLTHEAQHAAGIVSEQQTDCLSFKFFGEAAYRLAGNWESIIWGYWATRGQWMRDQTPGYYSADCPY